MFKNVAKNVLNNVIFKHKHEQEFFAAVIVGDLKLIHNIIKVGIDPNIVDDEGVTALQIVAEKNDLIVGKHLLREKKVDVNYNTLTRGRETALITAVTFDRLQFANMLLRHGADPNLRNSYDQTALHRAVRRQNCHMVKALLFAKAAPNVQDVFGNTPLSLALLEYPSKRIAKMLLEWNADPTFKTIRQQPLIIAGLVLWISPASATDEHAFGNTPLSLALLEYPSKRIAKVLLEWNADPTFKTIRPLIIAGLVLSISPASATDEHAFGNTPLSLALLEYPSKRIAKVLLEWNADPTFKTIRHQPLIIAGLVLSISPASATDEHAFGNTPLSLALLEYPSKRIAKVLLEWNADPTFKTIRQQPLIIAGLVLSISPASATDEHAFGNTPLSLALLEYPSKRIAKVLLEWNADPTFKTIRHQPLIIAGLVLSISPASATDKHAFGNTPLSLALLEYPSKRIAKVLLEWNADPTFKTIRQQPLIIELALYCRSVRHLQLMNMLLTVKGDVNIQNPITGQTALHMVSITGYLPLAKLLLKHGAKGDIKDRMGRTAYDMAVQHEQSILVAFYKDRRRMVRDIMDTIGPESVMNKKDHDLRRNVRFTDSQATPSGSKDL